MFLDEFVEHHSVGVVEVVAGRFVLAQVQHFLQRTAAQVVGDNGPVSLQAMSTPGFRQCTGKAGVPVEDRAARIKGQGFYIGCTLDGHSTCEGFQSPGMGMGPASLGTE